MNIRTVPTIIDEFQEQVGDRAVMVEYPSSETIFKAIENALYALAHEQWRYQAQGPDGRQIRRGMLLRPRPGITRVLSWEPYNDIPFNDRGFPPGISFRVLNHTPLLVRGNPTGQHIFLTNFGTPETSTVLLLDWKIFEASLTE